MITHNGKQYKVGKETKYSTSMDSGAFSRSAVNIIIPFHGQYKKVTELVESILQSVRSNPYQLCLVDDASPNDEFIKTFSDLVPATDRYKSQIVTFRNEERIGFGASLKVGFDMTDAPWVLFIHSDCLVEDPKFMIEMGRSLLTLKDKGVRMVSARSNNPGDYHKSLKGIKNEATSDYILNDETLPLYCMMCHRELFSHIGGFIKPYPISYYEDEELAHRVRKYGYKQAVCGNAWVRHFGGSTVGDICKREPEAKGIIENNRNLCIQDLKSLNG